MEAINIKCNRCKCYRSKSSFDKNGRIMKTCSNCREASRNAMKKNNCVHGIIKYVCKSCGGSQICQHGKQRQQCKPCGGSQICQHGKQRYVCKSCGGSQICQHGKQRQQCKPCCGANICAHDKFRAYCKICGDALQITITKMLGSSKYKDKKINMYDPVNFIDHCFLLNIIEDCEDKCHYCKCNLQYVDYQGDLATIERLDNSLGHIKSNCVIACRTCNYSKVGQRE